MTRQYNNYEDMITFTRASTGTYLDSDGVLKTAAVNVPRIEYDADGNWKGLLIEESRTNLLTYSEDFSNAAWVKSYTTVTANTVAAPDGTTTADKIVGNNAVNRMHIVTHAASVTSGQTYSMSFFAKAAEKAWARFGAGNSPFGAGTYATDRSVYFDLENGVVGTVGSTFDSASISPVGNGWYLCSCVGTATATTTLNYDLSPAQDDLDADYAGLNEGVYVWGAQLEAGAFPTSYIPTSGATATRSADVASMPVSDFGYNVSEGTVLIVADTISSAVNNHTDFSLSSSGADRLDSGSRVGGGTAGQYKAWFQAGGSSVALLSVDSVVNDGVQYKTAYSFTENNFALSVSGSSVVSDTTGAMPASIVNLRVGYGYGYLNGHIKSIQYYPRRLSNAQLQALTS